MLTQVQTFNDDAFVKTRQRPASGHTRGAFEVKVEPVEGAVMHQSPETIGFVAVAASDGKLGVCGTSPSL
eukprot:SAG22_NODE_789_length_7224_cov_2.663953_5_plen_70_part_00